MKNNLTKRWFYLFTGVFTMLFSGVLYAWSILKVPFKEDFGFAEIVPRQARGDMPVAAWNVFERCDGVQ